MEAKIDFKNLAKENIVKIADRLGDLHEDFGDVFVWTSDSVSVTKPDRFSSEEHANFNSIKVRLELRLTLPAVSPSVISIP